MWRSLSSIYSRAQRTLIAWLVLALLPIFAIDAALAPAAHAYAANSCGTSTAGFDSGDLLITPLHGKAFYLDTKNGINASYIGYAIKNESASPIKDLWFSVSDFRSSGTSVLSLANAADGYQPIGTIANGSTAYVYVLIKGNNVTTSAQLHDVQIHKGYPAGATSIYQSGAAQCYYSFQEVDRIIAASANKVTEVTINTTTPALGSTLTITVKGATGQGGSGSASPDGAIMWMSGASNSTWPTRALRLESTSITVKYKKNGNSTTFNDQLLLPNIDTGGTKFSSSTTYTATFTFRVMGGATTNPVVKPVANIASGTQIKHTGSYPSANTTVNLTGLTSTLTSTKEVVSVGAASGGLIRVNYKVTVSDSSNTSGKSLDSIVDIPDSTVTYAAGTATIKDLSRTTATTISDPVDVDATSAKKYVFGGPFDFDSSGKIVLTYSMDLPVVNGTYNNKVYGLVGGTIVGSASGSVKSCPVTVSGSTGTAGTCTNVTAVKQDQTIDFPQFPSLGVGASYTLDATATSGLPVTYASSTPSVCSVSGTTLVILATGTCTIVASQAGDDTTWNAAPDVSKSAATLLGQTITFNPTSTMSTGTTQSAAATASSGLPVTLTVITTDICRVNNATTPFTIEAKSSSGANGYGTCVIVASQAGNGTYGAAPDVERSIYIGTPQAIDWTSKPPDTTNTSSTYDVVAYSKTPNTSGSYTYLPVLFISRTPTVCTTSETTYGNDGLVSSSGANAGKSIATVTWTQAGICELVASQDGFNGIGGTSIYAPATDLTYAFMIGSKTPDVTISGSTSVNAGTTNSYTVTVTAPPDYPASSTLALSGTVTLSANGYVISSSLVQSGSVSGNVAKAGSVSASFNITAIDLGPDAANQSYDLSATFTTDNATNFANSATEVITTVTVVAPVRPTGATTDLATYGSTTATLPGTFNSKAAGSATATFLIATTEAGLVEDTSLIPNANYSGNTSSGDTNKDFTASATGLSPATTYFYQTKATRSTLNGYGSVKKFVTKPAAPTDVAVSNSGSVSFTEVNKGAGVTVSYTVTCTGGASPLTATGSSSPISVSGFVAGTTYTCTVTANSSASGFLGGGDGSPSSSASATAPLDPTVTTGDATSVTTTTASLPGVFNPKDASTSATAKFLFGTSEASLTEDANIASYSGNSGSGTNDADYSGSVTGLTSATLYFYKSKVTRGSKTNYGTVKKFVTKPAQVQGVSISVTSGTASVSFTPLTVNSDVTLSYTVTCTVSGGSTLTATGSTSPISVSGLVSGSTYSCTVTANSSASGALGGGDGAPSNAVNAQQKKSRTLKIYKSGASSDSSTVQVTYGDDVTTVVDVATADDLDAANADGDKSITVASGGCTKSGLVVSRTSVGTCVIQGNQAAGATYEANNTSTNLTIEWIKAAIRVTPNVPSVTYGDTLSTIDPSYNASDFKKSETSSSSAFTNGLTAPNCSASGYSNTTAAGTVITVSCTGGSATNYSFTHSNATFTVARKTRTLTLNNSNATYTDWSISGPTLTATASAGDDDGTKHFTTSSDASICEVEDLTGKVTFNGPGECVVTATIDQGTNHSSASYGSTKKFTIGQKTQELTFPGENRSLSSGTSVSLAATTNATVNTTNLGATTYVLDPDSTSASGCSVSGSTLTFTGAGTCYVKVTKNGNTHWTNASKVAAYVISSLKNRTLKITKSGTNSDAATITYGDTLTVSVAVDTADDEDPATTNDVTTANGDGTKSADVVEGVGNCTVSGFDISHSTVGTCKIRGRMTEGSTFAAKDSASNFTLTIEKAVIEVTPSSVSVTYGDSLPTIEPSYNPGHFKKSETASSNAFTNGLTAPNCSASGYSNTTAAGTVVTVTCSGGSATNYSFTHSSNTFTVARKTRTLTLNNIDSSYSSTDWSVTGPTLTSTPSAGEGDGTKRYSTSSNASICVVDELTGEVTFKGPGDCVVTATIDQGTNHSAASYGSTKTITIGKKNQELTFPGQNLSLSSGTSVSLSASTNASSNTSGLGDTTYTLDTGSTSTSGCSVSGSTLNFTQAGTCYVKVTKNGNSHWKDASPKVASFVISGKKNRTLKITRMGTTSDTATVIYGDTLTVSVAVDTAEDGDVATADSQGDKSADVVEGGTICSVSGFNVSHASVGTCKIRGRISEGSSFAAKDSASNFTLTIEKAVIDVTPSSVSVAYGDALPSISPSYNPGHFKKSETATSAAFTNGLTAPTCSAPDYTASTPAGTVVTVTCSGGSANNYRFTHSSGSFTVAKRNQSITFTSPSTMTVGDSDQNLTSSTNATGLTPTLTVDPSSSGICEIVSGRVRAITAGTCRINSNQPGNGNYNSASQVQRTFTINPRGTTVDPTPEPDPEPTPGPIVVPPQPVTPTPTRVQVKYDGNGKAGGNEPATVTVETGQVVPVSENSGKLEKPGYVLKEWNTSPDGKGTAFKADGSDTINVKADTVLLYAIWKPITITVVLDNNDGSNKRETQTYTYDGDPLKLPGATNSKKGYDFGGWQEAPQSNTVVATAGAEFAPKQETVLYAKWVEKPAAVVVPKDDAKTVLTDPVPAVSSKQADKPTFTPAPVTKVGVPTVVERAPETIIVRPISVQIPVVSSGIQMKSDFNWNIAITSTTQVVTGDTNNTSNQVTIAPGNKVTSFGEGFKPNSQVDIWVFSSPTWLGSVITDAEGKFSITLDMPPSLSAGQHTFQAQGVTQDGFERTVNVPILLLPGQPAPAKKSATKKLDVYFAMNSFFLDNKAAAAITKAYKAVKNSLTPQSKVTVEITGWVQPTKVSPNILWLSKNRAKVVENYFKKLGLKAKFVIKTPGHDKFNVAKSRRASVVITWTNPKSSK